MNKNSKDYEIISAYIDDELSPDQKREIEEKISLSAEYRKKYEEYKKVKDLTCKSVKPLPESPYFETRLFANIKAGTSFYQKFKKWIPATGFTILTISLMLILKLNPGIIDEMVEQQKANLSGFYTQNLKPLLFAANLTNEDIFNFAFYKQLPLNDQKNQYLQLGSDSSGDGYFEIKNAGVIPSAANLSEFVKVLNLNSRQKQQMDSMMASYAEDLQSQVLINEKNTIAINPNIWNYQKAICADLLAFASKTNKKEFQKVVPLDYSFNNNPSIEQIVHKIKESKDSKYIFFTPDSIFSESYTFDTQKFKAEMNKVKVELNENMKDMSKQLADVNIGIHLDSNLIKMSNGAWHNNEFRVNFDSNSIRVQLSRIQIPQINMPNFDSVAKEIEEATKHLDNLTISIPRGTRIEKRFDFRVSPGDSVHVYEFKMNFPNVDSLLKYDAKHPDSLFLLNGNPYTLKGDSLSSAFKYFMNDSLLFKQNAELKKQMKEFQKEINNFRKEMRNFKKNFKEKNTEEKKSITI